MQWIYHGTTSTGLEAFMSHPDAATRASPAGVRRSGGGAVRSGVAAVDGMVALLGEGNGEPAVFREPG